jgi:uncharacterized protein
MRAMVQTPKPWYREPWPWLLMLAPLAAVLMGILMVVLAARSQDGLVADDYYKQGLAINRTLDRERHAAALHVSGVLEFNADRTRAHLRLGEDGVLPPALLLTLVHPTRAGMDQRVTLVRTAPGEFTGELRAPARGRWLLTLEDDDRSWRVTGTWRTADDRVLLRTGEEGEKR